MFGSCAVSVVLFPSGASHFVLTVPPTPVEKGVTTVSVGMVSLNGIPMKPQTTGAATPGGAGAWMWAFVRLSFRSGVWDPVKSILKMVASTVIAVIASFSTKVAVPKDAGLGSPVEVVKTGGGTSCELVR